ncbi:hypothetical protein QFC21_005277 [Naganishia friedmannii]|uniref:Uncharacterized protein n=1 Tax=Naganishia friedmannii TaxID=89922 RepID=A0ACC2VBI1_9TREE|nr:hypothetical protein QFC21_005277 [Naganishia friedmannii]
MAIQGSNNQSSSPFSQDHKQHQQFYQQPQQQQHTRIPTSSSTTSIPSAENGMMSPGPISTSVASSSGRGRQEGSSVYYSAASSLSGGNAAGEATGSEVDHADSTGREDSGYRIGAGGDGGEEMRMPLDLEDDDLQQQRRLLQHAPQAYIHTTQPASANNNPSINLFQHHSDNHQNNHTTSTPSYLLPHSSTQPVSIPFPSPNHGRLAPGTNGTTTANAASGERRTMLQQPSPTRRSAAAAAGGSGTSAFTNSALETGSASSISPLPWNRVTNTYTNTNSNLSAQNSHAAGGAGGQGPLGVNHHQGYRTASQNVAGGGAGGGGYEGRPTSAMSSRGYGLGEGLLGIKDGAGGQGQGNARDFAAVMMRDHSNATGLQGIGIARAESPAMAELIARVARTEAALADLNQQVASLNTLVKGLQISAGNTPSPSPYMAHHGNNGGGGGGKYSGDMGRLSVPAISRPGSVTPSGGMKSPTPSMISQSSVTPTGPPTGGAGPGSAMSASFRENNAGNGSLGGQQADVANLGQQIAALSASVAQLQRMQTTKQTQSLSSVEKRVSPDAGATRGDNGSSAEFEKDNEVDSTHEQSGRLAAAANRGAAVQNRGENEGPMQFDSGSLSISNNNSGMTTPSALSITSPIGAAGGSQHDYFPPMGSMNGRPTQNGRHYSQSGGVVAGNGQGQQQQQQGLGNSMPGSLAPPAGRARPNAGRSVSSSMVLSQQQQQQGNMHSMNAHGFTDWPHGGGNNANNNGNGMKLGLAGNNGMTTPGLGGGPRDRGDPPTPGGTAAGPAGIMVSKWEHLPLSTDLQRQIVKYGIGPPNKIQSRALPFMLRGSDIIAQAPPTQERIITYVIPVVQLCLALASMQQQQGQQQQSQHGYKGPCAIIVTTTVDQATQAHKLVRDIGAPLGIRSGLAVGASGADISGDLRMMHQNSIQVVVGTPARLHDVFVKYAGNGGLPGAEVRMLVLDEVDQLIARNLYENVSGIVRLLPAPRMKPNNPSGGAGVIGTPAATSSFDPNVQSPFHPTSPMPYSSAPGSLSQSSNANRPGNGSGMQLSIIPERQTCIFSNTIPTDVINFSQSIQVREPVRVLVRREGGPGGANESSTAGNLRHYYLYLALASGASGRAARDASSGSGPGTIGSGRATQRQPDGEANKAKEYKLEALADLLQEYPLWQAIIHVGSQSTMEAVLSKLATRQLEGIALTQDMPTQTRQATLNKWRQSAQIGRGPRFLIAFDVVIKTPEVSQCPLVINYDLPRSVEGYAQRVAPALSANNNNGPTNRRGMNDLQTPSVILNFIQAAGGDVEMLRSTECAYRFKCSEVPSSFRDLF